MGAKFTGYCICRACAVTVLLSALSVDDDEMTTVSEIPVHWPEEVRAIGSNCPGMPVDSPSPNAGRTATEDVDAGCTPSPYQLKAAVIGWRERGDVAANTPSR